MDKTRKLKQLGLDGTPRTVIDDYASAGCDLDLWLFDPKNQSARL